MNPERQRIAIAEACGWRHTATPKGGVATANWQISTGAWYVNPPDYLNDLNAMHEAEKSLTPDQRKLYNATLMKAALDQEGDPFNAISIPSKARAEAFLRTIGKWGDGE